MAGSGEEIAIKHSQSRSTIETTTALIARTKYLRRSLNSQLKVLRAVQGELEGAAHSVKQEINATIKELEQADRKLQDDIELLRQTRIEDGFRAPRPTGERDVDLGVHQKDTLHDFVDDQPVEALRKHATAAHASVQAVRTDIDASIRTLEDDVQKINQVLADKTAISSSIKSDLQPATVPRRLKLLERNAHDMAQGLESLVQHFDSCVNAIKHTEGGGAAVAKNFTTEDLPEGVDVEAFQGPAESMSEEERIDMLKILKSDADQVDEVVADIQERGAEMEAQLDRVLDWREACETSYRDVASAFKLLEKVGRRLPSHVQEVTYFSSHWQEEKAKIEDCVAGMNELCEVYDNFLTAYDGMIVEAARRRAVRKRMEKIAQEAQNQLDQLYEDDMNEREHFRLEQGEHLPSDIWHGLNVLPAQYGFQRLDGEGLNSVPELPKEIVASALRRLKAAHGIKDANQR
ncbi:autophagy protein 17 [Exophiala xenobiotica]|uniref:Autophagy-related protein 17 n=1 Tax=Lithohypha guttulata TaxID=1690604 RepID=A0ABR0KM32_9EURO|nr:autophagy protein 17 [Lithohypha guttulata]KAK5326996.1 autophagy protein 17 [Exophiala xenobiotica]